MKDFNKINTEQLCNLIEEYASTWGSLSKKEFESRLFNILIESKVVTSNIYDIMSKLCVTRQKARNLLYEYNVRKYSSSNNQQSLLVNEMIDMLFNPIVSEDKNSKIIKLQVVNPYMIDYIKNIFARERILVDGSFSPDIITINKNEFMFLFSYCCINDEKRKDTLKERGIIIENKNLKNISTICSTIAGIFLNKLGERAVEEIFNIFEKTDLSDKVVEWYKLLFSNNKE